MTPQNSKNKFATLEHSFQGGGGVSQRYEQKFRDLSNPKILLIFSYLPTR